MAPMGRLLTASERADCAGAGWHARGDHHARGAPSSLAAGRALVERFRAGQHLITRNAEVLNGSPYLITSAPGQSSSGCREQITISSQATHLTSRTWTTD